MQRKLVKQGAATLMISLPAKWAQKNNLDKGDLVELIEKNNSIIISIDNAKEGKKYVELNITKFSESSIRASLAILYRMGYDKFKINYSDKTAISIIEDVLDRNLVGFEVINKDDKSCIIENITEPSKEQFDNIFLKVWMNIEELFDISESMLKGEKKEYKHVESKIMELDNFCRRVIAKDSNLENKQIRWLFHGELVHAQRELYHMLEYISKYKKKETAKISVELLKSCREIFAMLKEAYYNKDVSLIEKTHELDKELTYKKGYEILINNKSDNILIHHILSASRNFYLASTPLIGLFSI